MIIELKDVSLSYDRPILKNIDFKLGKGEIISIVGRSGAGKTSLLKIISGLIEPTSGEVLFRGKKVEGPSIKLIPGHNDICLVNQDFKLDEFHSTEENIRLQLVHLKNSDRAKFTDELLALLGLDEVRYQQARFLSGGEQQRLAIARVLAKEPEVILLDEPFSHLDASLRKRLTAYLLELRRLRDTSFILVSHDGAEVLGLSDVIYQMKNGELSKKGNPLQVFYRSKTLEDARLFGPMNSVKISEKRIYFRPDEFEVGNEGEEVLQVEYLFDSFTGPIFENYFRTDKGEQIVLFSFNKMNDVKSISIKRKSTKA